MDFSFISAHSASFMKTGSKLRGGGLHILSWDRARFRKLRILRDQKLSLATFGGGGVVGLLGVIQECPKLRAPATQNLRKHLDKVGADIYIYINTIYIYMYIGSISLRCFLRYIYVSVNLYNQAICGLTENFKQFVNTCFNRSIYFSMHAKH